MTDEITISKKVFTKMLKVMDGTLVFMKELEDGRIRAARGDKTLRDKVDYQSKFDYEILTSKLQTRLEDYKKELLDSIEEHKAWFHRSYFKLPLRNNVIEATDWMQMCSMIEELNKKIIALELKNAGIGTN